MTINDAIMKAQKEGLGIARHKDDPRPIWFIPTNTTEGILLVINHDIRGKWEPSAEDLISTDWYVFG